MGKKGLGARWCEGSTCNHFGGIASGKKCCASECGTCGGKGCSKRPGGKKACCHSGIPEEHICGVSGQMAPCSLLVKAGPGGGGGSGCDRDDDDCKGNGGGGCDRDDDDCKGNDGGGCDRDDDDCD